MYVKVYAYTGALTRSVITAILVDEMEVDELLEDEEAFAQEHGGDFIEISE